MIVPPESVSYVLAADLLLSCRSLLTLDKGKQIRIDLICVRGRHAMRQTWIEPCRRTLEQLG
jgi:hypothetical protein